MKNSTDRAKLTAIFALVLLMASVMLMANIPVKAQLAAQQPVSGPLPAGVTPNVTAATTAYLSFRPNPVGVGQPILVNFWTTPAPGAQRMQLDYKVTITKPDGTKDVIKMNSYPNDGTAWFEYVVDQVGTWKLKFEYPGVYFPAGRYLAGYNPSVSVIVTNTSGTLYTDSLYTQPSSTAEQTLTVQENMVSSWPSEPLPTDYWTRPVAYEHRDWWPILGNYPWSGPGGGQMWDKLYPDTNSYWGNYFFTPWVQGPNSAHVVWKRQLTIAGILGGDFGTKIANAGLFEGFNMGPDPSDPFAAAIVYSGRAYQTVTKVAKTLVNGTYYDMPTTVWQCYDWRTGAVYWEQTGITQPPTVIEYAFGQLGGGGGDVAQAVTESLLYIGSGRLIKYKPFTGAVSLNVSIAPLSSATYYMNGYALSVQNIGNFTNPDYRLINWTTFGTTSNFASRIVSNITWPWSSVGTSVDYNAGVAGYASTISRAGAYVAMNAMAANLKTGALLWNITREGETSYSASAVMADHGKLAVLTEQGYFLALDLLSGKVAWKSEALAYPWDKPGFGAYALQSAYGLLYHQAYTGIYAFDWKTGKIAWKFEAHPPYAYETPYVDENGTSVYSWNIGATLADGKMYAYNTEHSATVPITRGWKTYCINATTGECIWNVTLPGASSKHATSLGPIADGYMSMASSDGYMYIFGKGKSETTVEAPLTATTQGQTLMVTGTVLDQSPAQPGTPCVSKDSMGSWMDYLHKQLTIPAEVKGVPVSLDAVDPNGNFIHIGDVTTDGMSGTFGYMWKPDIPGKYTVTATFMGDDSYGSSFATTYVGVVAAPAATPTPTPAAAPAAPDYTVHFIATGIAIIIAVAIATILLLRKRT